MKTIFEYIADHENEIAYITRSMLGSWCISLKKRDNYTNQTISSYQKLSDADLAKVEALGIFCFDFKNISDADFLPLLHKAENLSKQLCY
jgi:hypothetical protein